MVGNYTLGGSLGEASVASGASVLVAGPPMTGKRRLARSVLQRGIEDGEGAIVISMSDTASRVRELFAAESTAYESDLVGVVDCVSETVGTATEDAEMDRFAASAADVTDVGIQFTQFIEYFHCERGVQRNRVLLDSITTLLQYSPLQAVFRFLHAVTTRVSEVGALGVFLVESTVHDAETLATIRELFDGVVETRPDGTHTADLPDGKLWRGAAES